MNDKTILLLNIFAIQLVTTGSCSKTLFGLCVIQLCFQVIVLSVHSFQVHCVAQASYWSVSSEVISTYQAILRLNIRPTVIGSHDVDAVHRYRSPALFHTTSVHGSIKTGICSVSRDLHREPRRRSLQNSTITSGGRHADWRSVGLLPMTLTCWNSLLVVPVIDDRIVDKQLCPSTPSFTCNRTADEPVSTLTIRI